MKHAHEEFNLLQSNMFTTISKAAENLHPGYFALVMATGIVSIASSQLGMRLVAWGLFWINVAAYIVLWALTVLRLLRHCPRMWADLSDHNLGPGFFTLIAGTNVLGSQIVLLTGNFGVPRALWYLSLFLWLFLIYTFFTMITIKAEKPTLSEGINGAWLVATVATQSVSILGTLLAGTFTAYRVEALFFTLGMYLLGCMLYILVIALIFYRFAFFELHPKDLTPPYWINMGAVAITTLAGATLILHSSQWEFLEDILPFLKGFTLFFWATGTWWIPLLFILGVWRHLYKRHPLTYHPLYWGMVFPLGMYTACTYQLAQATGLSFLKAIPQFFIYIALAAWLAAFGGLITTLLKGTQ